MVVFLILYFGIYFRHEIRIWNDINVYYISKDYFRWKEEGGLYRHEYYNAINMDKYRSENIYGRSLEEISKKFIGSRLGSSYGPSEYKRKVITDLKVDDIIFLNGDTDDFGWAIPVKNGICKNLSLIK